MRKALLSALPVVLTLLIVCSSSTQSAIIYVKCDSPNNGPGDDWDHAFHSVADGLSAAASGDEVWVARGTYVERITLKAGVALYGGFAGTETDLSERAPFPRSPSDPVEVTLDGDRSGSVVTSPAGAAESTIVDGFTIRNGTGRYTPDSTSHLTGGGIYCQSSSPTIRNNIIRDNECARGGGIMCYSSSPTITNNTITLNSCTFEGAGVHCRSSSSPLIQGNTFIANSAHYDGGGIYSIGSSPTVTGNIFARNKSTRGGAISCHSSSPSVTANIMLGNASSNGGAISCVWNSVAVISNNTIKGNVSTTRGGGIYITSSQATVINNTMAGNSGEAMNCESSSTVSLTNNTVIGSKIGLRSIDCNINVSNNIFAFNYTGIQVSTSVTTLRNNCVYGNPGHAYLGVSAGVGDISADPELVGIPSGSPHIQPTSPCVDAGYDAAVEVDWLDIDGQPRIIGGHVDIGADESDGTSWAEPEELCVRVSPQGDDRSDGTSWAEPKRTVQAAIDAVAEQGGEVWVMAGQYEETVTIPAYVRVYGGFAGNETSPSERNHEANISIIAGPASEPAANIHGGYMTSVIDGLTLTRSTSGVACGSTSHPIIRNNQITRNDGCGIVSSSATIVNNRISDNGDSGIRSYGDGTILNNLISGNVADSGGGIYCHYSTPTIANNVIKGNGAWTGGGIYCYYTSPKITNNTIIGNYAKNGGGICFAYASSPTVANNIIAYNNGGLYKDPLVFGNPSLGNNCVYGNQGYDYWGVSSGEDDISTDPMLASHVYGDFHLQPESPCVDAGYDVPVHPDWSDIDGQSRIQGDHVDIGAHESDGGDFPDGPGIIVRVSPDGNDENDGSNWEKAKRTVQAAIDAAAKTGGEVWAKCGVYRERIIISPYVYLYGGFAGHESEGVPDTSIGLNHTVIDGDQEGAVVAIHGGHNANAIERLVIRNGYRQSFEGGVWCYLSSPRITNSIVVENQGNGIHCRASSPTITNNTIVSNSWGGIWCEYSDPTVINNIVAFNKYGIDAEDLTLRNNCFYGNEVQNYNRQQPGIGDISLDPLFRNRDAGDYHLTLLSPCVNAGWNEAPGLPDLDIDGEGRVAGGTVDIGADEFWWSMSEVKQSPDNFSITRNGAIVSAVFGDSFYIQADDRSSGIRVYSPGHDIEEGLRADVEGVMKTDDSGERYIQASHAPQCGSGSASPLLLSNRMLGGSDFLYDPLATTGQRGVEDGVGLNNIGLLVRITGRVSYVGEDFFYIDDGTQALDGSSFTGVRVLCGSLQKPEDNHYVTVTGISSIARMGDEYFRAIRPRTDIDIQVVQ